MTSATSEVLRAFLADHNFRTISSGICVVAVVLLVVATIERELLRVRLSDEKRRDMTAFAIVITPMALIFVAIVVTRFLQTSA